MPAYDRIICRETRTARTVHKCDCGKPINRGEKYHYEFGFVEGERYISKMGYHIHRYEEEEAKLMKDELQPFPEDVCEHDYQEQPGEPPFDVCHKYGDVRW